MGAAMGSQRQLAGDKAARIVDEAVVDVLFSLGDGLAMRMLSEPEPEPERDFMPTIQAGTMCVHALLDEPA